MDKSIKAVRLPREEHPLSDVSRFGVETAKKVRAFHRSFPGYAPTPLADLRNLAQSLGLASIHVKDESRRFGLNAFKALGGSYAIGRIIAQKLGEDIADLPYERMVSGEIREKLGEITFITATDGNHGRGVAWTANRLGQKSIVYMPKGTSPEQLENIRKLGSDASITDLSYDDCVRKAAEEARKNGYILVQDTSRKGYEEIPTWIMQGYTTLADEAVEQLHGEKPTHVFLQAGVGSMAGAVAGYFADLYGEKERPVITVVEPNGANCLFRTALENDGKLHFVRKEMRSIMAGLCCGEPCPIAWDILKDHADCFVSVPDHLSAKGMRILGNAMGDDPKVVSGESGAVTLGLVADMMRNPDHAMLQDMLGISASSRILCISTEGDTDKAHYRRIVEDGLYPSF